MQHVDILRPVAGEAFHKAIKQLAAVENTHFVDGGRAENRATDPAPVLGLAHQAAAIECLAQFAHGLRFAGFRKLHLHGNRIADRDGVAVYRDRPTKESPAANRDGKELSLSLP